MSAAETNVVPFSILANAGLRSPEEERKNGFQSLSPLERQVAIEFAVTGHTLKQIARDMGQDLYAVQKAFRDPCVRAFIADLQDEIAQHKIVNAKWVEDQVLRVWPQLIGEEPVAMVCKEGGEFERKKFHAPEVVAILKHFGGNKDQAKANGVNVQINFGDMGVQPYQPGVNVQIIEHGDNGE